MGHSFPGLLTDHNHKLPQKKTVWKGKWFSNRFSCSQYYQVSLDSPWTDCLVTLMHNFFFVAWNLGMKKGKLWHTFWQNGMRSHCANEEGRAVRREIWLNTRLNRGGKSALWTFFAGGLLLGSGVKRTCYPCWKVWSGLIHVQRTHLVVVTWT